jgi:hypothetical protein
VRFSKKHQNPVRKYNALLANIYTSQLEKMLSERYPGRYPIEISELMVFQDHASNCSTDASFAYTCIIPDKVPGTRSIW